MTVIWSAIILFVHGSKEEQGNPIAHRVRSRLLLEKSNQFQFQFPLQLPQTAPVLPLSRFQICIWWLLANKGAARQIYSDGNPDKVVGKGRGWGLYHVAGYNSDRLSHPDSPTGGAAIYPGLQPDALHLMRRGRGRGGGGVLSVAAERHLLHTNTLQGSYYLH